MKPRNREINIFNMSLLDILCGALGAFCFLMLALFPYYAKSAGSTSQNPEDTNKLKQELAQARAELQKALDQMSKMSHGQPVNVQELMQQLEAAKRKEQQAAQQLKQAEQKINQNRAETQQLQDRFDRLQLKAGSLLVIVAEWQPGEVDVDLWVRHAKTGEWEGPKKETPDGGKLAYQIPSGPGIETFHDDAAFGRYEVYYRIADRGGKPALPLNVTATISTLRTTADKGSNAISWMRGTVLAEERKLLPAFTVTIDEKRQARIEAFAETKK